MSRFHGIGLVAARDFTERLRSRAFLISTGFTLLIVVAAIVAPTVLEDRGADTYTVGVVGGAAPAGFATALGVALEDTEISVVDLADRAAAEEALRDDTVDAVVSGDREVIIGENGDEQLAALTVAALGAATFQDRAVELGLTTEDLAALLGGDVTLTRIDPEDPEDAENRTVALFGTILLFISIVSYGQWILIGVIEEKTNRVVEVVLGAVRPARLLAGKIIGIGLLGLLQLLAIAAVALVTVLQVASVDMPSATGSVVAAVIVWFVLGFVFYAAAYAAAGSLVTRQEEAQNAAFPLTMLMMIAYFIAIFSATGDNPVLRIASLLPPFAPMTMPMRMSNGDAALWEIGLSFSLMVAAVVLLIRLAGRIYAGGILRTGGKVKLREAWRSAEA